MGGDSAATHGRSWTSTTIWPDLEQGKDGRLPGEFPLELTRVRWEELHNETEGEITDVCSKGEKMIIFSLSLGGLCMCGKTSLMRLHVSYCMGIFLQGQTAQRKWAQKIRLFTAYLFSILNRTTCIHSQLDNFLRISPISLIMTVSI